MRLRTGVRVCRGGDTVADRTLQGRKEERCLRERIGAPKTCLSRAAQVHFPTENQVQPFEKQSATYPRGKLKDFFL